MSIPQSAIHVCSNVRLNSRYEHTIYFADRTEQLNYFAGKVVKTFSAYSFIRKSWDLNVAATMEEAASWSYLYFTNTANGKRYFYFIDNIEYVNDGTVRLKLQIDVLQTYLFDFELLPCFIERQHTPTDAIGDNTIDEGLELGELVSIGSTDIPMGEMVILLMSTIVPHESTDPDLEEPVKVKGSYYNGIYNGVGIFGSDAAQWRNVSDILHILDTNNFSDGIMAIWMYPKKLVTFEDNPDLVMRPVKAIEPFFEDFTRPPVLAGGYFPRNNKLFTYPFNQLYFTNNTGGAASFAYERFGDPTACNFKITGALSPEGKVRAYPLNYAGEQHAYEHGLTLDGFPNCAWNQDVYKLWLAQNQNQQDLSLGLAALSIAGGVGSMALTGGAGAVLGMGSVIGGAQTIASILAQRKDQQLQPPQAKGTPSTSINTVAGFQTFTVKNKCVDAQHARIIDDYFTMYGYKLNRVDTPNIRARNSHTYIKTVGCHIEADLCNEDATKIESIFDNGVTFWTDGDRIGQYNDNNNPL